MADDDFETPESMRGVAQGRGGFSLDEMLDAAGMGSVPLPYPRPSQADIDNAVIDRMLDYIDGLGAVPLPRPRPNEEISDFNFGQYLDEFAKGMQADSDRFHQQAEIQDFYMRMPEDENNTPFGPFDQMFSNPTRFDYPEVPEPLPTEPHHFDITPDQKPLTENVFMTPADVAKLFGALGVYFGGLYGLYRGGVAAWDSMFPATAPPKPPPQPWETAVAGPGDPATYMPPSMAGATYGTMPWESPAARLLYPEADHSGPMAMTQFNESLNSILDGGTALQALPFVPFHDDAPAPPPPLPQPPIEAEQIGPAPESIPAIGD